VARIIYVEDEPAWIDLTRSALMGHQVDAARTFDEAVSLIQGKDPYDLALVDLNLRDDDDRLGGEILDLLKMDYPNTLRIVVTGHPPVGGLRANIFERYGVEEVIIKGHTTLPELRKIVTEVLRTDSSVNVPQEFKVGKSELSQRYRDWHSHLEGIIRTRTREAQSDSRKPGRTRGEAGDLANKDENRLLLLREEFVRQTTDFEEVLSGTADVAGLVAAGDLLDRMISRFATRIDGTTTPGN
jgi:CheY-like chemotaxis protein